MQQKTRGLCDLRRDPTCLNLSCLHSLTHLELVGCDLSISAWVGLEVVQPQLQSLACLNTLEQLWHLLSPNRRPTHGHGNAHGFHQEEWLAVCTLKLVVERRVIHGLPHMSTCIYVCILQQPILPVMWLACLQVKNASVCN